jgi:hypothetical protein
VPSGHLLTELPQRMSRIFGHDGDATRPRVT